MTAMSPLKDFSLRFTMIYIPLRKRFLIILEMIYPLLSKRFIASLEMTAYHLCRGGSRQHRCLLPFNNTRRIVIPTTGRNLFSYNQYTMSFLSISGIFSLLPDTLPFLPTGGILYFLTLYFIIPDPPFI